MDESAHAALAWDIVAFALGAGGLTVRKALAQAVAGLAEKTPASAQDPACAALKAHGFLFPTQQAALTEEARKLLIVRMHQLLDGKRERLSLARHRPDQDSFPSQFSNS